MNFFEVKIGKRTRRGTLEVMHSYVLKTNLGHGDAYFKLVNQYNGFDVELNNIQELKEDIVEEKKSTKITSVNVLNIKLNTLDLRDKELNDLRLDYEVKSKDLDLAEEKLRKRIYKVVKDSNESICQHVYDLEKTHNFFSSFKITMALKGDLKQILEEND